MNFSTSTIKPVDNLLHPGLTLHPELCDKITLLECDLASRDSECFSENGGHRNRFVNEIRRRGSLPNFSRPRFHPRTVVRYVLLQ